jgi:hypothetical protein
MRFRSTLSTLVALAAFAAAPARAQCTIDNPSGGSCQLIHSVRATANTVASLNLSSGTTSLPIGEAAYTSGSVSNAGPVLTVASNASWSVSVASNANTWSGPTGTSKPSTDLVVTGSSSTPVSTTAATIASGTPQAATGIVTLLSTSWSFVNDPPGIYNIDLIFTLTAP